MMNEAQLHEENTFITLTYNEENLPTDQGLDVRHWQLFMKRLRKKYAPKKIRFYHCGEYGDTDDRPHYHAILFGHTFRDQVPIPGKENTYYSQELETLWGKGFTTTGNVVFETAAYIARYCMKKQTGKNAEEYELIDPIDFQVYSIQAPYSTMSRKPGIGRTWYDKYKTDCYPSDFLVFRNQKMKPPKIYETYLEEEDTELYKQVKFNRAKEAKNNAHNNTTDKLYARSKSAEKRQKTYQNRKF